MGQETITCLKSSNGLVSNLLSLGEAAREWVTQTESLPCQVRKKGREKRMHLKESMLRGRSVPKVLSGASI